jgi:hypothetical protein
MSTENAKPTRHPLLETVLAHKGLPLKGTYTVQDVAGVFEVTPRTIQVWIKRGNLHSRSLPGRAKFLAIDLEEFLDDSSKVTAKAA